MTRFVYVSDGYVIQEANEPYFAFWEVKEAPEGVPVSDLSVVDGKVVRTPEPEPPVVQPPAQPEIVLEGNPLVDVLVDRLNKPLDQLDYQLVSLAALTLSLYLYTARPDLLQDAVNRLSEYLNREVEA